MTKSKPPFEHSIRSLVQTPLSATRAGGRRKAVEAGAAS